MLRKLVGTSICIFFSLMFFISCGTDDIDKIVGKTPGVGSGKGTGSFSLGNYVSSCGQEGGVEGLSSILTINISLSRIVMSQSYYNYDGAEPSCENKVAESIASYSYSLKSQKGGSDLIKLNLESARAIPLSEEAAQFMSSTQAYGYGIDNWENGVEQDITTEFGASEDSLDKVSLMVKSVGNKLYVLFDNIEESGPDITENENSIIFTRD